LLPELGEKLGRYAQAKLASRGVEIRPKTQVTATTGHGCARTWRADLAATLIWTAVVTPNSVIAPLPL